MNSLCIDVGGANIKFANSDGNACTVPFPLWKQPELLSKTIKGCLTHFSDFEAIALTMTGELADCYQSKSEGVNHILNSVEAAASGVPIAVWQTAGEFVSQDVASEFWMLTAASNWHALATWVGRMQPEGFAILIDCGSTTTDIIPIIDGIPMPLGRTDLSRMQNSELLYRGIQRTPVCGITASVQFDDETYPVAAEVFSTSKDVFLILGLLSEDEKDLDTADGRPFTLPYSRNRLAHQFCCDTTELSEELVLQLAQEIKKILDAQIESALKNVISNFELPLQSFLISGSGESYINQILDASEWSEVPRNSLVKMLGSECSNAACAFALARLATERVSIG